MPIRSANASWLTFRAVRRLRIAAPRLVRSFSSLIQGKVFIYYFHRYHFRDRLHISSKICANTLELAIPAEAVRHGPPPHGHAIPGDDRALRRGVGPRKKDPPITIVGRSKNHIG